MIFLAQSLIVKPSSLLIASLNFELMVRRFREWSVAVLSPNKKFLYSVFIYSKAVRNNAEILFLSGSGEQGSPAGISTLFHR